MRLAHRDIKPSNIERDDEPDVDIVPSCSLTLRDLHSVSAAELRAKARERAVEAAQFSKARRERNKAAGNCINENNRGTHGPATHGVRCERCARVWKESR